MCQEHGWENGRVSPRSTHRARLKPHPSWEKVDGWRMLAYKDGERVRLVSRNGRDHTRRFADLAAAVGGVKAGGGGAYEGLVAKDERAPGSSQAVDEN
jgi:ATP-dependent DNA ligase